MGVKDIRNICNVGTGTMGHGTAVMFAKAGYNVRMYGRTQESIDRGLKGIRNALQTYRDHQLVTESEVPEIMARIQGVTSLAEAARDADFVIESVAEELAVKHAIFKQLDKLCPAHTIFATNTSGLSPTAVAEAIDRKDKFVVAHFWNPPHLVPLVEVVPGKYTAQETVDTTWALMEKIGKKPVALKREALGFIGNRLQLALLREAMYIVEQGIATPEAVDATVRYSLGRRYGVTGPLESADLGGLDIFQSIAAYLFPDLCNDTTSPALLAGPVARGDLGSKTGKGFYDWSPEVLAKLKKQREAVLIDWLQKDKREG
jgi:3-hydroxybutyryl-CoA dehydrogenase